MPNQATSHAITYLKNAGSELCSREDKKGTQVGRPLRYISVLEKVKQNDEVFSGLCPNVHLPLEIRALAAKRHPELSTRPSCLVR